MIRSKGRVLWTSTQLHHVDRNEAVFGGEFYHLISVRQTVTLDRVGQHLNRRFHPEQRIRYDMPILLGEMHGSLAVVGDELRVVQHPIQVVDAHFLVEIWIHFDVF